MARFHVTRNASSVEIAFDDGGMNLLSSDALRELSSAVAGLPESGESVFVFRSARPNLFAAGADMNEMREFSAIAAMEFARAGQELFDAIERLPMLTVARIEGDCFGGALDLALAFDVRIASPSSRFSHPGARLGIVTGFGGTSRWRKVLDTPAARSLLLSSPILEASDAATIGLVDEVTDGFDAAIARFSRIDVGNVRMIRELRIHGARLSQRELYLLASRLGQLYGR